MDSQRNPRWSGIRLGTSLRTIGSEGCLLCGAAALVGKDPAWLNRWLVNHGGFSGGNLFVFKSLEPLGAVLVAVHDWRKCLADFAKIQDMWKLGRRLLIEVNFYPYGRFVSHWVYAAHVGAEDIMILDPWMPPECVDLPNSLLATYARPNQGIGHSVYRVAEYAREEKYSKRGEV